MKIYNGVGPNPRIVRMCLAEKGLEIPFEELDIMSAENRRAPYTDKNPFGQLPALELDDGSVLSETPAVALYLDDRHPEKPLFGISPEQRAETLMWALRVILAVAEPMSNGFRFAEGLTLFQDRMRCLPESADGYKAIARDGLEKLDGLLATRQWLAGDRFSYADVLLYCMLDFFAGVGQPRDPALKHLEAWFERVNARPSAEASLHPRAKGAGMRA